MTDVFDQEYMDSLWEQYRRKPSIALRDLLVVKNQGLVVFIANRYYKRAKSVAAVGLDDLIGVGMLGLIHAVDHVDFERVFKFSSYAYRCIQGKILAAIFSKGFRSYKSLDDIKHENDGGDATYTEHIEDMQTENPSDAIDQRELKEAVSGIIDGLDEREQYVIRQRFYEKKGLGVIGEPLGLTRERVRQIITETIAKIGARADVQQKLRPYFETSAKSIYLRTLDKNSFIKPVKQPLKAV